MMNLYPMPGMGATGMGMGASPQLTPQMMAAMSGAPLGGAGASPMSAYLALAHPMMNGAGGAPQAAIPQPQQPSGMGQQFGAMAPQLQQLLAALKGGQQGVTPPQQGGPNPDLFGVIPNWLQGYRANGMPGQNIMGALSGQAAANNAAGASGL